MIWSLLGFCTVVSAVAFALLLAPAGQDGPLRTVGTAGAGAAAVGASGEGAVGAGAVGASGGGVLADLTPTGWVDALIALLFGAVAFALGSYLTAKAAAESDADELTLELSPVDA